MSTKLAEKAEVRVSRSLEPSLVLIYIQSESSDKEQSPGQRIVEFFSQFPGATFDPKRPIMPQFNKLVQRFKDHYLLVHGNKHQLYAAMARQFGDAFGQGGRFHARSWLAICDVLSLKPVDQSMGECKKASFNNLNLYYVY
jgi:hypothetical protein